MNRNRKQKDNGSRRLLAGSLCLFDGGAASPDAGGREGAAATPSDLMQRGGEQEAHMRGPNARRGGAVPQDAGARDGAAGDVPGVAGVIPGTAEAISRAASRGFPGALGDAPRRNAGAEQEALSPEQRLRQAEKQNAALREQLRRQAQEARSREIYRQLEGEAERLRQKYPGFDPRQELQNPRFSTLLRAGVPMEQAYQVLHYDALMEGARASAAAEAERRVTEHVRARGSRPQEAGTGQSGAFTTKTDAGKLSREDMAEIKRRVLRGEKISF